MAHFLPFFEHFRANIFFLVKNHVKSLPNFFLKKQIFSLFYNIKSSFSWKWRVKSKIPDPGEFCMALNSYEKNFGTFYPFFQKVWRAFWQHTKKAYFYLFPPFFGCFSTSNCIWWISRCQKKKNRWPRGVSYSTFKTHTQKILVLFTLFWKKVHSLFSILGKKGQKKGYFWLLIVLNESELCFISKKYF